MVRSHDPVSGFAAGAGFVHHPVWAHFRKELGAATLRAALLLNQDVRFFHRERSGHVSPF